MSKILQDIYNYYSSDNKILKELQNKQEQNYTQLLDRIRSCFIPDSGRDRENRGDRCDIFTDKDGKVNKDLLKDIIDENYVLFEDKEVAYQQFMKDIGEKYQMPNRMDLKYLSSKLAKICDKTPDDHYCHDLKDIIYHVQNPNGKFFSEHYRHNQKWWLYCRINGLISNVDDRVIETVNVYEKFGLNESHQPVENLTTSLKEASPLLYVNCIEQDGCIDLEKKLKAMTMSKIYLEDYYKKQVDIKHTDIEKYNIKYTNRCLQDIGSYVDRVVDEFKTK